MYHKNLKETTERTEAEGMNPKSVEEKVRFRKQEYHPHPRLSKQSLQLINYFKEQEWTTTVGYFKKKFSQFFTGKNINKDYDLNDTINELNLMRIYGIIVIPFTISMTLGASVCSSAKLERHYLQCFHQLEDVFGDKTHNDFTYL